MNDNGLLHVKATGRAMPLWYGGGCCAGQCRDSKTRIDNESGSVFSEMPPFPHNMLVELANACNHKCVFCGYKGYETKEAYM